MRMLLLIAMIAYVLWPVDILPMNPIDDIIVLVAGQIVRNRLPVNDGR